MTAFTKKYQCLNVNCSPWYEMDESNEENYEYEWVGTNNYQQLQIHSEKFIYLMKTICLEGPWD